MERCEELTIARIRHAYLRSELSAVELTEYYLGRIAALDKSGPALHAVNTLNPKALDDASRADVELGEQGTLARPLAGIPVLVKDQIDTAGLRTTYGSVAALENVPRRDAAVVARLRAAGAIILGKTAMADFGASWFSTSSVSGLTRNPYALAHDSGGSSAGSAVAVAANLSAVAVGGDTGGSVRLPASFCNVVGLRPTPGRVSCDGVAPLVAPQDTVGPMGRTVADVAALYGVMAEVSFDPSPERAAARLEIGARPAPKLGVVATLAGSPMHPESVEVASVLGRCLGELARTGVETQEAVFLALDRRLHDSSLYLARSRSDLNDFIRGHPGIDAADLAEIVERGAYHPALDLLEAIALGDPVSEEELGAIERARRSLRMDLLEAMNRLDVDVLVYPTVRVLPPSHADLNAGRWPTLEYPTNTVLASQTGLPALTVPVGFSEDGLPVGMELLGRPFEEATLFWVGSYVEAIVAARVPPVFTPPEEPTPA